MVILAAVGASLTVARATELTDPDDPRNWQGATVGTFAELYHGSNTLANRQAVINAHILDDGIFGNNAYGPATLMHTAWSDGSVSTGHSLDLTGTGGYDYVLDGGDAFGHANGIDNQWFQSSGTIGDTVFDLGGPSVAAAVFAVVDHGPLPQETIESTVYLSNDLSTWVQAEVRKVYLEGFQPILGIQWDGFTYVVSTPGGDAFRYASIIHGGPGALISDGDDEINGMMGLTAVPEPGTMAALAMGGLALLRKRRRN